MDLLMTMFKPRSSMSPTKVGSDSGSVTKRKYEPSPTRQSSQHNGTTGHSASKSAHKRIRNDDAGEPKFTFDEVKTLIDRLLTQRGKAVGVASSAALRHVDFDELAVPGHSAESCKDLIEKLMNMTRRVRTLHEVLTDIKENLGKRIYTEAIMRATMHVQPPKKPPSAYLIYHKERYEELRDKIPQASEIAKIVSDEWKKLTGKQREPYFKRHNELMKKYQKEYRRCGLVPDRKPKRLRSAKAMYAQSKIEELSEEQDLDREEISRLKEQFQREYDELDKDNKAHWIKQYKLDQERYKREHDEYIAANPHLDHHVPERVRASKHAIKPPTPPKNALKFFLAKKLPDDLEGQELEEAKLKMKEKFSKLSDKKLLKYIKKAIKDKERYDAEIKEFKEAHPEVSIPKLKPTISKDQWKLYASVVENKPMAPAPTAYLYFCGKALSDTFSDSNQVPTQRMQTASLAWSNLSEEEKLNIEREHVAAIKKFLKEMDSWMDQQDEERRNQIWKDEPRSRPDYWRKRLARMEKNLAKRKER